MRGKMINAGRMLAGKSEVKRPVDILWCRRDIVFKLILKQWSGRVWTGDRWLRVGSSGGIL
jgi:hypothetical protein